MRHSQSVLAGLRWSLSLLIFFSFLLGIGSALSAVDPFANPKRSHQFVPADQRKARDTNSGVLELELASRMQALEIAKRSAEPSAIANASKSVLASAMREMGNLQFARGSATAAIEAFRRSNDFDDSVNARIDLAQAYLRAQNSDKALPIVTDVLVNDPDNARAWYVEGEVWMAKKWFEEAAKSFHRALSLKEDSAELVSSGSRVVADESA